MPKYGLLIDYEFCIGCHVCELACKQEHNRPPKEWGILLNKIEPEISGGRLYYFPFPTDKCNLCARRTAKGYKPACVAQCWAQVMKFGTIKELTEHMQKKPRSVLWAPH